MNILGLFVLLHAVLFCGVVFAQSNDEKYAMGIEYHQKGLLAFQSHEYDKADNFFKKSLELCMGIEECSSSNYAWLGHVYRETGLYSAAIDSYENSLKIDRDAPDLEKDVAITLNNLALCYLAIGQQMEALKYQKESLEIRKKMNEPDLIATILLNIGTTYSGLGDFGRAISSLEESMNISKKHDIKHNIPILLFSLGSVYSEIGQYETALRYLNEAIDISKLSKDYESLAKSLHNIAAIYSHLGFNEQALKNYKEAVKIKRGNKISPDSVAVSLDNIGYLYLSMRNYKQAEKFFTEAEKEMESSGYDFAKVNFVELYLSKGEYSEALKLLRIMAPQYQDSGNNRERMQYNTQFGLALKGSGDLKTASVKFLQAIKMIEEMRSKLKTDTTDYFDSGTFGGRIRPYKVLVATLADRSLNGEKIDKEFTPYGVDLPSSAFYFSEATKARTLLEHMAESGRRYARTELPEDMRKKEDDLLNQLSAIDKIWEDTYKKGEEVFKELIKRKEGLQKELDSLIEKIRKEYPLYASLNYPKPIPVEDLLLKDNEVLLEYAVTDDATYLFKVIKGKVDKIIKIAKGKEEMENMINEFILPLQHPETMDYFSPVKGQQLYELLLEGAIKDISNDKKIIIVPDGILGVLPFEVLVTKAGKHYEDIIYVGDKWTISYAQSATVLSLNRLLKPSKAKKPLFALGNPVYNDNDPRYIAFKQNKPQPTLLAMNINQYSYKGLATRMEYGKTTWDDKEGKELIYPPLPETEMEVKAIAKLFRVHTSPPDVFLNMDANETKLRGISLKDYHYIHFSSHADLPGKLQGINEPFILLGQVENKSGDDGFLTLSEVLGMKLDADMVVLSACLTGRGKVIEGEGVANFARAFQYAGARSVVVSLWEVASDETSEYMTTFYGHLKAGTDRVEALRLTRKEIKAKYPNPYFWAPFILHGEG